VAVDGEQIIGVGTTADVQRMYVGEIRDLGDVVLLPGLINAHCHLDYTCMKDEVELRETFIQWLLQIVMLKKLKSDKDYIDGMHAGIDELVRSGTTTVVNY